MGKPLMLQEADAERLEALRQRVGAKTKIAVVRSALTLLERQVERAEREERWVTAVQLVADNSRHINKEFRTHSRLHKLP